MKHALTQMQYIFVVTYETPRTTNGSGSYSVVKSRIRIPEVCMKNFLLKNLLSIVEKQLKEILIVMPLFHYVLSDPNLRV